MNRLRARPDYLAAAKASRIARPAFVLQARSRVGDDGPARFGFTVTRRIGNAVVRNRARRRLKELARAAYGDAHAGIDYVLVARIGAVDRAFADLARDLASAIGQLHRQGVKPRSSAGVI